MYLENYVLCSYFLHNKTGLLLSDGIFSVIEAALEGKAKWER